MSHSKRRILCFCLCFSFTFLSACSALLYHPSKMTSADLNLPDEVRPENVHFVSRDGTQLHGWYFEHLAPRRKGRIVFFHGNAGNVLSHFSTLHWIVKEGYDYFIFDYQGYGMSQGVPAPKETVDDGVAALCWAAKRKPWVPLIVLGQSLGGTVALRSLAETGGAIPFAYLIVDSSFHSYKAAARSALAQHWLTWLLQPLAYITMSDRYAPKDTMKDLPQAPLLVIHGTDDRIVSFQLGKKVFDLAPEPKEFLEIPKGRHIDFMWREEGKYRKAILQRINEAVAQVDKRLSADDAKSVRAFCETIGQSQ